MPRKNRLTRNEFEMLLHGEVMGKSDVHCPICGVPPEDLTAKAFGQLTLEFNSTGRGPYWVTERIKDVRPVTLTIITCTCGFVADQSFFVPDEPFPILKKDEEYPNAYFIVADARVKTVTFTLSAIDMSGKWRFTNSKAGRIYYELLQIVNAGTVSELPASLVSEEKWIRELAKTVFDKLKYKRAQPGLPSNPY